jgi:L-fucose mutarotase
MLIGLSPLLTPDLLYALAAMGHGDEIAIVDANFPATSVARRLIQVPGAGSSDVLEAVLSLMPLDTFVTPAAVTMEIVGDPETRPVTVADFDTIIARRTGAARAMGHVARQAFYDRARAAFAVVHTGDRRGYANILLVKGVIRPD